MTPKPARAIRYALNPRRPSLLGLLIVGVLIAVLTHRWARPGQDYVRYHNKTFTVARVIDGDTLALDVPDGDGKTTTVRLRGVDTPETVHPDRDQPDYFGPQASAFTKELAAGRQVRVELWQNDTRDKYHRLLAYIYLPDGTMLNERILQTGHGYADTRSDHPRANRFLAIEAQARKNKRGLWKSVRPEQMPRWRQQSARPAPPGRWPLARGVEHPAWPDPLHPTWPDPLHPTWPDPLHPAWPDPLHPAWPLGPLPPAAMALPA